MARPRNFDEMQVMRRARDAFHDGGYAATSIEQLTVATGLQRSSIYGAFGDKHALFLRSFSQYCDEEMSLVESELVGEDATAFARLGGHFRVKTADLAESRRGCLLSKASAELASEDPEVVRIATDAYAIYERALSDCFRGAQAAGDAREDIEPARAGAMLLAALRGIEALGRVGHSKRELREIGATALAALAVPRVI